MITLILLFLFLAVATFTDVRQHIIYNWTTYPGIVVLLIVNYLENGAEALESGLLGFLACGFIMLLCFMLFGVGGGDVKMLAMMGAGLGLYRGIEALLWTFVLGAILALSILVWQIGAWRIVSKTVEHVGLIVKTGGWVSLTRDERKPLKRGLFLAPSGLLATVIVTWSDWQGFLS